MYTNLGNDTERTEQRTVTANDVKAYNKACEELRRLQKIVDELKPILIHEAVTFGTEDPKKPGKYTLNVGKTILTATYTPNNRFCEADFKAAHPEEWESFKKDNPYYRLTANV